jgi:hypothetical protein
MIASKGEEDEKLKIEGWAGIQLPLPLKQN